MTSQQRCTIIGAWLIEILKNHNFFFELKGKWGTKISMRKTLRERSVNQVLEEKKKKITVTQERKVMEVEYGSHAILQMTYKYKWHGRFLR